MSNDNLEPWTFICPDCGARVYDALNEVRPRCLTCQWVVDQPEDERPFLRALLNG